MPLTIEHHAVMFALLAKHAIEISGEKGKGKNQCEKRKVKREKGKIR